MKVTSRPNADAVPQRPANASLDLSVERRAFEEHLKHMLADPTGSLSSTHAMQAAFAGPTVDGVAISDLEGSSAAELLRMRQDALGQTAADAKAAGEPVPPAIADLLDSLAGLSDKVAGTEAPSDGYDQGTTHEELEEMKDLLAGHSQE